MTAEQQNLFQTSFAENLLGLADREATIAAMLPPPNFPISGSSNGMFKWSHGSVVFYYYYKCGFSTFEALKRNHGTSSERITSHVLVVRSPYKRVESFYKDKIVTQSWKGELQDCQNKLLEYFTIEQFQSSQVSFELFVVKGIGRGYVDRHLTPLCEVSPSHYDVIIDMDKSDEVSNLKDMLGMGVILPHVNKTFTEKFAWTTEMLDVAHRLYRYDNELFGFEPPMVQDFLGKSAWNSGPPPRILIGVCSCAAHGEKREAVRATWAAQAPAEIDIRFFIGGDDPQNRDDVIGLPVNDSYPYLPSKVMAFFRHALEHLEFDWLFKCDDDTYVDLTRLPELTGNGLDLIGNEFLATRGSPSGGAGYFLSRSMVQRLVAEAVIPLTGDEDVLIGEAAVRLGAVTCATKRLIPDHRRFPRLENAVVTSHWCSPERMRAIHTIRFSTPVEEVLLCHPQWTDTIQFFEDGTFVRKSSGCAGMYEMGQGVLQLRWFDWGSESFELAEDDKLYPVQMPRHEPQHARPLPSQLHLEILSPAPAGDSTLKLLNSDFPLISCVMPTYGRPDYVNEAIQMFLDQDYPNKELIILNDCEGQRFTCDLPPESGVRIINHPKRFSSLGEKRNACIELAKGPFIAIWDDDDVYLPWRLSYTYRMMKECGTPFYLAEEFFEYWGDGQPLHEKNCATGHPCHPNSLFEKDLWHQVGGYPSLNVGEDSQFF